MSLPYGNTPGKVLMFILLALSTFLCGFLFSHKGGILTSGQLQVNSKTLTEYVPTPGNPQVGKTKTCSQQDRISFIRKQCRSNEVFKVDIKQDMAFFVYDKLKLLYCPVYKSGTVTFRTELLRLDRDNRSVVMKEHPISALHQLSQERHKRVMREYKKLIVVRHPFDRLRATYDKKLSGAGEFNNLALHKNLAFVNDYLMREDQNPFDPTEEHLSFVEFLTLVSQNYTDGFLDCHWQSFVEHCRPCQTDYDFVIRLETLSEDLQPFLKYLSEVNNGSIGEFEHLNNGRPGHTQDDRRQELIQRYHSVGQELIGNLYDVYKNDFVYFGYGWDSQGGASCNMNSCC